MCLPNPTVSFLSWHLYPGQADLLCMSHTQNREACVHWSEGRREAAGVSGLVGGPWHTVGVFVLDNIQSFPTKSGLDHFSLNLTCLGCSLMGKGFKDYVSNLFISQKRALRPSCTVLVGGDYELTLWQRQFQVQSLALPLLCQESLGRLTELFWAQFSFLLNEDHHLSLIESL